jgi:serine/threonine protein phosphatase PrpC
MTNFEQHDNNENPELFYSFTFGEAELGHHREGTQDTILTGHYYAAVFDGMGGNGGNPSAASKAAAEGLEKVLRDSRTPTTTADLLNMMKAGFEAARQHVAENGGGGSTVGTAIRFAAIDGELYCGVAHAGDTRLYLYRNGEYLQLTEDQCDPYERNKVTNGMFPDGRSSHNDIYGTIQLEPGDRLMLCSDGITGDWDETTPNHTDQSFSKNEMLEAFNAPSAQDSADTFLRLSLPKKRDDKSVVVIDVDQFYRYDTQPASPELEYDAEPASLEPGHDTEPASPTPEAKQSKGIRKLALAVGLGVTAFLVLKSYTDTDDGNRAPSPSSSESVTKITCKTGVVEQGGSPIQAFYDAFSKFDEPIKMPSDKEILEFGKFYEPSMRKGKYVHPGAKVTVCTDPNGPFQFSITK